MTHTENQSDPDRSLWYDGIELKRIRNASEHYETLSFTYLVVTRPSPEDPSRKELGVRTSDSILEDDVHVIDVVQNDEQRIMGDRLVPSIILSRHGKANIESIAEWYQVDQEAVIEFLTVHFPNLYKFLYMKENIDRLNLNQIVLDSLDDGEQEPFEGGGGGEVDPKIKWAFIVIVVITVTLGIVCQ